MSDYDSDYEPIPGLPWAEVAKKLHVVRAQTDASSFIEAIRFVLGEEFDGVHVRVGRRNWGKPKKARRR